MEPPPAALTWKPFRAKKQIILPAGLLAPPVLTLTAAFRAVEGEFQGQQRPSAYLVRPFLDAFLVYRYALPANGGFSLDRVLVTGLPFGGTSEAPRAWLVDGKGRTGTLVVEAGRFRLVRLGRDAKNRLVPVPNSIRSFRLGKDEWTIDEPPPGDAGLPWVVGEQLRNVADDEWTPEMAFRPGLDEAGVVRLVKWLHAQPTKLKVKAGGSRHSWSKVAATDGAYIHPEGMRCLEPAEADQTLRSDIDQATRNNLFRIGAGTVIREINDALWDHGKAFAGLGGYDGQTLGGVLPTGTHGSILSRGPLAEMVRSIDLVTGTGESLRIEPKDGPTDPVAFSRTHPNTRLIQKDEPENKTFDAVLIHLGAMGVVRSLVVEVRDRFYLKEVRTRVSLKELLHKLEGGAIYHRFSGVIVPPWVGPDPGGFAKHPAKAYHLEFLFNPEGKDILVTTRQPAELPGEEPPFFRQRPEPNLFRLLATPARYRRGVFSTWISETFPDVLGWLSQHLMETIPSLTPGVLNDAMRGLKDAGYVHRSYRVFNIGDGQNAIPNLTGTIFVPLRANLYLDGIRIIRDVAAGLARKGMYQTGPIALRFIRGSRAMLASPEDVCSFELIFVGRTRWAREMIEAYDVALRSGLGDENVRFHWGQLMPGATKGRLRANFTRYGEWRAVRDAFDPDKRFLNTLQEEILPEY